MCVLSGWLEATAHNSKFQLFPTRSHLPACSSEAVPTLSNDSAAPALAGVWNYSWEVRRSGTGDAQSWGVRKHRPQALGGQTAPSPLLVPIGEVGHCTPSAGWGLGWGVRGPGVLPPTSPRRGVPPPLPEIHFLKN